MERGKRKEKLPFKNKIFRQLLLKVTLTIVFIKMKLLNFLEFDTKCI